MIPSVWMFKQQQTHESNTPGICKVARCIENVKKFQSFAGYGTLILNAPRTQIQGKSGNSLHMADMVICAWCLLNMLLRTAVLVSKPNLVMEPCAIKTWERRTLMIEHKVFHQHISLITCHWPSWGWTLDIQCVSQRQHAAWISQNKSYFKFNSIIK